MSFAFVVGLPADLSRPAFAEPPVQIDLEKQAKSFMTDWQKEDYAGISSMLAPDFMFAGPRGFATRGQTLTALTHCILGSFSLDAFQFREMSENGGILAYRIVRDMTCGGHKVLGETINTDVFVRTNGSWKIVFTSEIALTTK